MAEDWPVVTLLALVGVLLLATAGVALAGVFGLFGTDEPGAVTESAPVPTPTATTAAGTATQPFALDTRGIENCGMLCRNVTSTVTNEQATAARDVTISTRLYAGNDTDGEVRWRGTERVSRIGPGETFVSTQRVELS